MENINDVIIGGLIALGGVFLGGLITLITEWLRHKWSVSDRQYQRRKDIVDKRCDQAEIYAQAATDDFRRIMHDARSYLDEDNNSAAQRLQNRKEWIEKVDTKLFSLGPAISALSDEELKKTWDSAMDKMDELNIIYNQISEYKFNNGAQVDKVHTSSLIEKIWLDYSRELGNFYKRVDLLRYKLSENPQKQNSAP